jgi:cytochrome c oxidase subunit 2
MRAKRFAPALLAVLAALVLVVEPVAAQTSLNEELIRGLNLKLLYAAIPITILVELILVYVVLKFKDNEEAQPTQENRRLEITWTVATAIILLFVGFASYQVLGVSAIGGVTASTNPDAGPAAVTHDYDGAIGPNSGEDAVQVEVVAQKYFWTFNYEGANVSSTGELVIPADRTVYIHITSTDWLHSFHVPGLGLKQDAFPGQYNTIKTEVYETGTYQLYCAEYCGVGHSSMLGTVKVVSPEEYDQWLAQQQQADNESSAGNSTATGNETASGNETAALVAA